LTNSETAPRDLAPGTELELDFTDLLANGQAVARAHGLVVFCFGPLPAERALVRVTTRKPAYAVAEMRKLLRAAPERADPFCPVFGECGGCQVQHLSYEAQLRWKRDMVRSALQRIGGIGDAEVAACVGTTRPRDYRNKMALVVEHRAHGAAVGFYRARSHELVPIEACPVVAPQLSDYIARLARAAPEDALGVALSEATHVIARCSRKGEAVVSVTTPQDDLGLAGVSARVLEALPGSVGLADSCAPKSANVVMGRRQRLLAGRNEIEEEIGGIRYRVSPASFFQINVEIVERIFETITSLQRGSARVLDLYCGMGTFSLLFARNGAEVIGVEENRNAVAEATSNAALNGLEKRASFASERVERWVRTDRGKEALRRAKLVFLDPPRKGSDEVTLRSIASARVRHIMYLSCDPATLARDLRLLLANGYALHSVQPFDMFAQTGHVETLVTLERT